MLDNFLYLVIFTFELAKHKMATKILREPRFFYGLSHTTAQFMVPARFLFDMFFLVFLERYAFFDLSFHRLEAIIINVESDKLNVSNQTTIFISFIMLQ